MKSAIEMRENVIEFRQEQKRNMKTPEQIKDDFISMVEDSLTKLSKKGEIFARFIRPHDPKVRELVFEELEKFGYKVILPDLKGKPAHYYYSFIVTF